MAAYVRFALWYGALTCNEKQFKEFIDYYLIVKGDDFVLFFSRKYKLRILKYIKMVFATEMSDRFANFGLG
jgi:hypothetical protein